MCACVKIFSFPRLSKAQEWLEITHRPPHTVSPSSEQFAPHSESSVVKTKQYRLQIVARLLQQELLRSYFRCALSSLCRRTFYSNWTQVCSPGVPFPSANAIMFPSDYHLLSGPVIAYFPRKLHTVIYRVQCCLLTLMGQIALWF